MEFQLQKCTGCMVIALPSKVDWSEDIARYQAACGQLST